MSDMFFVQNASSTEHTVVRSAPDGAAGHPHSHDAALGSDYSLTHAQHLSLIGLLTF